MPSKKSFERTRLLIWRRMQRAAWVRPGPGLDLLTDLQLG